MKHFVKYLILGLCSPFIFHSTTHANKSSHLSKRIHPSKIETYTTAELNNLSKTSPSVTRTTAPVQNVELQFTAATVENSKTLYRPQPNCNGWVGPEQYILMSNNQIRSFNKLTGQPDGVLDIDPSSFFQIAIADARIDFDRFGQRWFFAGIDTDYTTGSSPNLHLAFSDSAIITPNTKWTILVIPNAQIAPFLIPLGSGSIDYDQLAIDQNAVYVTVQTFDGPEANFYGASAIVFQKSSLTSNNPVITVFTQLNPDATPSDDFETYTPPADNFDRNPTYGYILGPNLTASAPNYNLATQMFFYRVINPGSSSPSITPAIPVNLPPSAYITATDRSDSTGAPHKGNLFGPGYYLQTLDNAPAAAHIRNHQLFTCTDILVDDTGTPNLLGDRIGVVWYQFDLTGGGVETESTVPILVQSGVLYDPTVTATPLFYFNSSIMTNKNGDLVIIANTSGVNEYVNIVYAGRKATDQAGQLRTPVTITNNIFPYNFGLEQFFINGFTFSVQRWGDLSSLAPDPVNDLDMWLTNQLPIIPNGYGITVAQLTPAS